ncbi:NAD(P)H-binding protein [Ramlibacter sp.]|uniref:NAD-dependent epimerase/dehydratase family protein n=1 Tax=Ramlibacter sp. TaxID=1917967 RepID=UPI0017954670|nr:NAD(P)H-binding protein [Ramlibacter sp.]MBA2673765.1 NAD(P)H-binding protein [Ramlibacter sp.]
MERTAAFVTGGSGFLGGNLIEGLVRQGVPVRALARSDASAERVRARGAEAAMGDLDSVTILGEAMRGCDTVFHAAAWLPDHDRARAWRVNVQGTANILAAARAAGVRRVVYVSGTGVTIGSGPVVDWDEARGRGKPVGVLSASRIRCEEVVEADPSDLEKVIVRFPYLWGNGDTFRPVVAALVRGGRFRWIARGEHKVSVCHIDNAVHGLLLAATRGVPGRIYWIADDQAMRLKDFVQAQLDVDGLAALASSMPLGLAKLLAELLPRAMRLAGIHRHSPLTPTTVRFLGQQITVDTARARRELGYRPLVSWEDGLRGLLPVQQARAVRRPRGP